MRPVDADKILLMADVMEKCWGNRMGLNHEGLRYFIGKFPTLDITPIVHGKWYFDSESDLHCDQCDWSFSMSPCCTIDDFSLHYCPNCGAKMSYEDIKNGQET